MENIELLDKSSQDLINRLRSQEKSSLAEADLAVLSARSAYLTDEEKMKLFGAPEEPVQKKRGRPAKG